jgi:hypothetical protein
MTKNELIQAWRDFEARVNAQVTSEPFDLEAAFTLTDEDRQASTPAVTAGRLLVEYGDAAAKHRFEDRMAEGLSIVGDEVYRLLTEAAD